MPIAGKTGVVEQNPNNQTIKFGGQYVCLTAIARAQSISVSHVSRVFSGERGLSMARAKRLAAILGMSLDQFDEALEIRVKEAAEEKRKLVSLYESRVDQENREDLETLRRGGIPVPRLPVLRSA